MVLTPQKMHDSVIMFFFYRFFILLGHMQPIEH